MAAIRLRNPFRGVVRSSPSSFEVIVEHQTRICPDPNVDCLYQFLCIRVDHASHGKARAKLIRAQALKEKSADLRRPNSNLSLLRRFDEGCRILHTRHASDK